MFLLVETILSNLTAWRKFILSAISRISWNCFEKQVLTTAWLAKISHSSISRNFWNCLKKILLSSISRNFCNCLE